MTTQRLYQSSGVLRYSRFDGGGTYKLIVEIEPDIARLARSLAPPWLNLRMQRYAPHISIVRHEVPPDLSAWGLHEGKRVPFMYGSHVYNDEAYYWIQAYSPELVGIRLGLGLPESSLQSRPPDGVDCFHITIGNTKPVLQA